MDSFKECSESSKQMLGQYIEAFQVHQAAFDELVFNLGHPDENRYQTKMNEALKNCENKALALLDNSTVWQEIQQKAVQTFKELNQLGGLAILKTKLHQGQLSGEALYRLVQYIQQHHETCSAQVQSQTVGRKW